MKIQSQEIAMQSQHEYSRVELESSMSFSTFFTDEPLFDGELEKLEQTPQTTLDMTNSFDDYFSDTLRTLNGIIENLMSMFNQKRLENSEQELTNQDEVFGYTHISWMQRYEEHERLDVSTIGRVNTDKGSIDLNLNFSMSRDFVIENHIDVYSSFDPLVINLEGDIPNLSTDTFSFDLDNDGESDQISKLASGSGFLALDKNEDGAINQGSELFGTLSGDGFGELSKYDEDKNSWIDENDSIFDKLQIWLKNDDESERELVGLGEVGIGAIFLESTVSDFRYKTNANQTLGDMRSSGIFLNEDGSCGNISKIDFATREPIHEASNKTEPLANLLQA
jgi:hypothetical protein